MVDILSDLVSSFVENSLVLPVVARHGRFGWDMTTIWSEIGDGCLAGMDDPWFWSDMGKEDLVLAEFGYLAGWILGILGCVTALNPMLLILSCSLSAIKCVKNLCDPICSGVMLLSAIISSSMFC